MEEIAKPNSTLTRDYGLKLLYTMYLIRRFEEKSAEMYSKSKIRGFLHLYIGEEAVATGVMHALGENDNVLSTYREHGHALARGLSPAEVMAEMFGKKEGCSRGRGGSMHLFDVKKKFYGGNAIVGGHLPVAVGMALAEKKLEQNNITCCLFGEGAAAEGEFHEAMNLASLWKVPLLFVCENNLYAMGTALKYSHAMTELEKKGAAYGIESAAVDGMNVLEVAKSARKAIDAIKENGRPYFLVCNTYRFRAHSMFDAELYREKSEVEEWKKRDPIKQLESMMLIENMVSKEDLAKVDNKVMKEVEDAVECAEKGGWEQPEDLLKDVYSV